MSELQISVFARCYARDDFEVPETERDCLFVMATYYANTDTARKAWDRAYRLTRMYRTKEPFILVKDDRGIRSTRG